MRCFVSSSKSHAASVRAVSLPTVVSGVSRFFPPVNVAFKQRAAFHYCFLVPNSPSPSSDEARPPFCVRLLKSVLSVLIFTQKDLSYSVQKRSLPFLAFFKTKQKQGLIQPRLAQNLLKYSRMTLNSRSRSSPPPGRDDRWAPLCPVLHWAGS